MHFVPFDNLITAIPVKDVLNTIALSCHNTNHYLYTFDMKAVSESYTALWGTALLANNSCML